MRCVLYHSATTTTPTVLKMNTHFAKKVSPATRSKDLSDDKTLPQRYIASKSMCSDNTKMQLTKMFSLDSTTDGNGTGSFSEAGNASTLLRKSSKHFWILVWKMSLGLSNGWIW